MRIAELATTDTLVETVHVTFTTANWYDLGWKSLAVNLSDIASMGGNPTYALVTLGLPSETQVDDVLQLYDGLSDIAARYEVRVVGGDMVRSEVVFVTVSLNGEALPAEGLPKRVADAPLLRRSAAKLGDLIAVTGYLGGAAAGLRLLLAGHGPGEGRDVDALCGAQQRPVPRVVEGQMLLKSGVLAAMDISDGLVADLGKLCLASGSGARIRLPTIPVSPAARDIFGREAIDLALGGGEDYELLFTAPRETMDQVISALPVKVSVIGEMIATSPGEVEVLDDLGQHYRPEVPGWDHYGASLADRARRD